MAIDINKPVEQGHDVVINHEDGTQSLGTAEELQAAVEKNDVIGMPPEPHTQEPAADKEAVKATKERTAAAKKSKK